MFNENNKVLTKGAISFLDKEYYTKSMVDIVSAADDIVSLERHIRSNSSGASSEDKDGVEPTIPSTVKEYLRLENLLELHHKKIEEVSRKILSRKLLPIKPNKFESCSGLRPLTRGKSFARLKVEAEVARSVFSSDRASMARSFVLGVKELETQSISSLNDEITILRARMRDCEESILDKAPETFADAVEKLKFISALLLQDCDIDIDFFAYVVDECAQALENLYYKGNNAICT